MFNPIHYLSLIVCILLVVGAMNRRRKRIHIPIMLSAIVIDLGMVLYIELTRGAVKQASAKMGPLMIVHIVISCGVLVLYGMQIWTGIRKALGVSTGLHRRVMIPLISLRILNFLTSVMVMDLNSAE